MQPELPGGGRRDALAVERAATVVVDVELTGLGDGGDVDLDEEVAAFDGGARGLMGEVVAGQLDQRLHPGWPRRPSIGGRRRSRGNAAGSCSTLLIDRPRQVVDGGGEGGLDQGAVLGDDAARSRVMPSSSWNTDRSSSSMRAAASASSPAAGVRPSVRALTRR